MNPPDRKGPAVRGHRDSPGRAWELTIVVGAMLLVSAATAAAAEKQVVLFDAEGFADADRYPAGHLRELTHGDARWQPASGTAEPAQIVELDEGPFDRVLRRQQTAAHPTDTELLDFPPVQSTTLTVTFDARVSTAHSRTLDVFLMQPGETGASHQASILIWGHVPGKLTYFDGDYRPIADIDDGWHRYKIVHDLAGNTFDLFIDGGLVGELLPWRNRFDASAAFGRLRIGAIRGEAGDYADIANLRITADPTPPTVAVVEPDHPGRLLDLEDTFTFTVSSDRPVDASDIAVELDGENVTDRLRIEGEAHHRRVRLELEQLEQDRTYEARITAANERGVTEQVERFYTFENRVDGYRGIWFTLGQLSGTYGDKYAGGFAFCFSHTLTPMAVYAEQVDKTFFVYGGTTGPESNYLLVMASYYDHANHRVPQPTIVRDQQGVDDPHDNPSLTIDDQGHIWVFIAGRGRSRPGQIFRSTEPWSVSDFEKITSREQTYSQVWYVPGRGFMHLLTLYTAGRELYWETSTDGRDWTDAPTEDLPKLAGFRGHYQVSRLAADQRRIGTAFNYHPGGSVDRRTNIYYVQTEDFGETWTTVDGQPLSLPLEDRDNPALAVDYEAEGRLAYITKLLFDDHGNPVILAVTSEGHDPGPANDPRIWEVIHWTGQRWITREITRSDHNYDMGSLYIDGDRWTLIGPALPGP